MLLVSTNNGDISLHLNASFILIVPNLDGSVVGTGNEIGFFSPRIIFETVDSLRVPFEREVWLGRAQLPNLNEPIQRGRCEGVVVFWIERHLKSNGKANV